MGNLSLETTEDELRREFTAFGEVISVTIMNDKYTGSGQPRGYGYVKMALSSEGTTAIANLEGKKLGSRVVYLVEALPLSNKNGTIAYNIRNNNRWKSRREGKYQII